MAHGDVVAMSGCLAGACLPVVDVAVAVVVAALGAVVVVVQYVVVVAAALANVSGNR